ncbi:hypothetical protein [Chromobacterium sp. ASV23]|uniref:hypothetical protein n=1 Tax=Chromobacterium sp. ASV23 TaxID=2795110 RepID=UPI0018ECBC82|nr:hypothetical protein [Chromobacterium sp. ASV23]
MSQLDGFSWRSVGAGLRTVGNIASGLGAIFSVNANGETVVQFKARNGDSPVSLGALQISVEDKKAVLSNPTDNDWVVTFTSVDTYGNPNLSERLIKKGAAKIDVTHNLAENLTGLANYSIVHSPGIGNHGTQLVYCIKNWGSNTITAFGQKFIMAADTVSNEFIITSANYEFEDVSIQAVSQSGDVYNFAVGKIPKSQSITHVSYPPEMDQFLPIARLTISITGDINYLNNN